MAKKAKKQPVRWSLDRKARVIGELKSKLETHQATCNRWHEVVQRLADNMEKMVEQSTEGFRFQREALDGVRAKIESLDKLADRVARAETQIGEFHAVLSAAQEHHSILRRRIYALESATPAGLAAEADKRIQAIEARTAEGQKRIALIEEHIRRYYDGLAALDPSTRIARVERELWPQDPYCGQEGRSPRQLPGNGQPVPAILPPPHPQG